MEQLRGLWRDTWWVWCVFIFISVALAATTSWVALAVLPCLSVSFCYFAYIRYDENGNEKGNY